MTDNIIRVGTGVMVLNDKNQFLMGKRKSAHGAGGWNFPGGHVDFGETLEECAYREVLEETGLEIGSIKIMKTTTHFFDDKTKHYVTVYLIGRITGGTLEVKEPHKLESWQFFDDWNDLPKPLFVPYQRDIKEEDIKAYIKEFLPS